MRSDNLRIWMGCRPLAYSTLADLVHHVRQSLPLHDLSLAVSLFSKNVHDESLPSTIQTMSCKLLLNLVECIRVKSEQESGNVSHRYFGGLPLSLICVIVCRCMHECVCVLRVSV